MSEVIYMKVTKDEYELPVAVADTVRELARIVGLKENSISMAMWRANKAGEKCQFVKVVIDED